MNVQEACELIEKYARCPKCGCEFIGNGEGTLEINESTFKRTCRCGWSVIIEKMKGGIVTIIEKTKGGIE